MRLDKFLSEAGAGSRKELRAIIKSGRVCVDGQVVLAPEGKIDPAHCTVTLDGRQVTLRGRVVLMLHKPAGYVTSTDDPRDKTVMDLLPQEYQDLFPVGRLDKDTEGLLLFTNDGDLCHRLTAPKHQVEKEYFAQTDGAVDADDVRAFQEGIALRDGTKCLSAQLLPEAEGCRVVVREGKYHQVRRMLAARGKPVVYLRRMREGTLSLGELPLGQWRQLRPEEIDNLL